MDRPAAAGEHALRQIAAEELAPIAAAKRSLGDGFGATADWYREAGWLPPKCGHRPVL